MSSEDPNQNEQKDEKQIEENDININDQNNLLLDLYDEDTLNISLEEEKPLFTKLYSNIMEKISTVKPESEQTNDFLVNFENLFKNQIEIINRDIKDLLSIYENESFDLVLSNPPYFKKIETSIINENVVKSNARHEILINLEEIILIASKLLKNKGSFALVHRTERLSEIIELLKKYRLEPKTIRFIHPKKDSNSNLVLIEAKKNSNIGVKVLKPLIVHDENLDYTKEVLKMFKRGE